MTADGGDVFPLTYGEFDATAPRWSRDGRHVAYISNEGGNTSLWILDLPGAWKQRVVVTDRRYREPMGKLRIVIVDRDGHALAARVSVSGPDGRAYAPDDAWRHADEAFDRAERPFQYSYFHTVGNADLTVGAARTVTRRIVVERLADLPAHGWWSGDLHVHMNYGGAYRNTPAHLAFQARAEDLHVVEALVVNKEQRIPDIAYFRTGPDPVSTSRFLLMHGQEYHTSYWEIGRAHV